MKEMKKTALFSVLVLGGVCAALFMAAPKAKPKPGQEPAAEKPAQEPGGAPAASGPASPAAEEPKKDFPDRTLPTPGADRLALASDCNAFSLDLYQRLRVQDGNLFFSPYSVFSALAMTYSGAGMKTSNEMRRVLHFTVPDERMYKAFSGQVKETNDPRKPFALAVANSLFGQAGLQYKEIFLTKADAAFGAGLTPVDFKDPAAACAKVNAWVTAATHGKITSILQPDMVSEALRLVLVNAIYFKGDWARKFDKDFTQPQPFYVSKPSEGAVPLMRQTEEFQYAEDDIVQVLGMPYKGKELSMVVVLPKQRDGLANVEKNLNKALVERWLGALHPQKLEVWFPKFKLETTYRLKDDLKALGIKLAFDPDQADFSGMLDPKVAKLFISFVIHKAFVEVNEEGTEAAAVTAVGMDMARAVQERPPEFKADHPFLFFIREDRTNAILFMGRFSRI